MTQINYALIVFLLLTPSFISALGEPTLPSDTLDFYQALEEIVKSAYELKSADAEIIAKEAERWQAAAYPNPIFSLNITSLGRNQEDNENEVFVGLTQIIELGGKRLARLGTARAAQGIAESNLEIAKNDLFSKLLFSYLHMAIVQERIILAEGQQKIAKQILEALSFKAKSGKTSGIEEKKARVAFQSANLVYLKQKSNLRKAKKELSSLWDTKTPSFKCVDFPLYQLLPPPPLETLSELLVLNPQYKKAEAEIGLAEEMIFLQKSKRISDLAFQIGVTTEKFTKEPALSLGFAIPLPILDNNEGNVSRASYDKLQAIYHQMDVLKQLRNELEIAYHDWTTAYEQALILKQSLLPAAEEAFLLAEEGFNEGKFDCLNLLDARSTFFDIQQQYLEAIEEYHHKSALIQVMIGPYF